MKEKIQVSIVSKDGSGWHVSQVVEALNNHGITNSVIDFDASRPLAPQAKNLGELTLWRSSSLNPRTQRTSMASYLDRTKMVNEAVFVQPAVTGKYYQQQTIAMSGSLTKYAIPTFMATSRTSLDKVIKRGDLSFPIIAKPNNGSRGEGIHLLQTLDDIKTLELPIKEYVFQSFMTNQGDWRVIVIGGRAVGVMKRIAQEGSYLNNVSRGARAVHEVDDAVCRELFALAPRIAALFRLRFCGVDLIRNAETGELKILEVNTAPQWDGEFGFQSITGVNVGDEFAKYASHMLTTSKSNLDKSLPDRVDAYYKDAITSYKQEAFHYASRIWLWKKDKWARAQLDKMRAWYIGDTPDETRQILKDIVDEAKSPTTVNQNKTYRKQFFEKYDRLPMYNALLFKVIFCNSLYGYDIRPFVKELVSEEDFLRLFGELIDDRDAIRTLSTHAINFFYLLKNYFTSLRLSSSVLIDPGELLDIAGDYSDLVERKLVDSREAIKLQIYLLTHAILGESRFYQRKVSISGFGEICKTLEGIIRNNYFNVSLDNKMEFLVCADICGYRTGLRDLILKEAEKSISWAGPFLVERDAKPVRHVLSSSEHRNVLFVMASWQRFVVEKSKKSALVNSKVNTGISPIGRLARVRLPGLSKYRFIARVDTGATRSSLCVSGVHVNQDGVLEFAFLYPGHPLYTGQIIKVSEYSQRALSGAGSKNIVRYIVKVKIVIGNNDCLEVNCNLADRQHLLYPVLIGRDILRGRYKVDTGKQFTTDYQQ